MKPMNLTLLELRKLLKGPVILVAIIAIFALNILNFMTTGNSYYAPGSPESAEHIAAAQENGAYFKGAITEEWSEKYFAEAEAIRTDPANRVSGQEAVEIMAELKAQGYEEEYIEEHLGFLFMKEEVKRSNLYTRFEPVEVSMKFYEHAAQMGASYGQLYRLQYPGEKGEALAARAEADYGSLASDYTAYYNYDLGYQRMSNILLLYHNTLAVLMIVGLSGIFSNEYTRKTDALLLSSRHGKRRLALAKLQAGLLFSVAAWLLMTLLNLCLTTYYFGWEGWEAYWQDWYINTAPWQWNQGIAMAAAIATSLLGTLYFALVMMAVSALARTPLVSVLAGFVIIVLPSIELGETGLAVLNGVFHFMPSSLMRGPLIWMGYMTNYLFGHVVLCQPLILVVAVFVSLACGLLAIRWYERHQVSN